MPIYDEEPYTDSQISFYVGALHDLETERSIGMAAGPIPWTAQLEWARYNHLDREATMLLTYVIRYVENDRAEVARKQSDLDAIGAKKGRR